MEGTYKHDLFYGTFAEELMELLGRMAYQQVFTSRPIYRMEVAEAVMIDYLMDCFVSAIIKYDDPGEELDSIDERMVSFISSNYKMPIIIMQRKNGRGKLYLRLLLVTDYICGMTDSYAKRLYQELKAIL